ncbi:MAG: TetR/AcrR family transcriptional regulator [Alphaproteobacteria bacterium]|nr:TetR/AcrR family transcriptional regulator [Alphaproteobacteria bacterium]
MNLPAAHKTAKAAPEQVLDAAAACFMEKGYAGTSLDDVARHMGATKGRIYHYFGSKSELLHAVRKHAMGINFAAIRPAYNSDLAPVEKFRAMAQAHAYNMIKEQAYQKALFGSLHLHITGGKNAGNDALMQDFITDRRAFEDMFRDVLQAGQESGDFDIKTISYALHTALTTLNSTLYWYTPRDGDTDKDRRAVAQELVEMALRALGACHNQNPKGNTP